MGPVVWRQISILFIRGFGAVAIVEADFGHALAEASLLDEVFLEAAEVLVEEVIGLVEEANGDVGDYFGGTGVHEGTVGLVGGVRLIAETADVEGFLGVFLPDGVRADAEVILIVDEEFLQAGAGDVGEFDLGFGGGLSGFAAFGDVLFAGPGGLDHLVDGAVSFFEEAVAEVVGKVEDDFGFLVGEEILVVSTWGEEAVF
jgi:hypothetical protein